MITLLFIGNAIYSLLNWQKPNWPERPRVRKMRNKTETLSSKLKESGSKNKMNKTKK